MHFIVSDGEPILLTLEFNVSRNMVKLAKLYAQLLQSTDRTITFRDFERLLRVFGFVHERTTGSHRQYIHPKVPRPFPVQPVGKDAKRYQVRQLLELIETYGLYIEE